MHCDYGRGDTRKELTRGGLCGLGNQAKCAERRFITLNSIAGGLSNINSVWVLFLDRIWDCFILRINRGIHQRRFVSDYNV